MVEQVVSIDDTFASLADPIRRDIIERLNESELSVNEIALEYDISLAAISKHLKVLAAANLVKKRREGKYIMVQTNASALVEAQNYLASFFGSDGFVSSRAVPYREHQG